MSIGPNQAKKHLRSPFDLPERHPFVRCVRLRDVTRTEYNCRNSCGRERRRVGSVGHGDDAMRPDHGVDGAAETAHEIGGTISAERRR